MHISDTLQQSRSGRGKFGNIARRIHQLDFLHLFFLNPPRIFKRSLRREGQNSGDREIRGQ
jgi:hypothetical protein